MTTTSFLIVAPIVLPLAAAVVSYLAGGRATRALLGVYAAGLTAMLSALVRTVWRDGTLRYAAGGWGAPLGIELRADGLAVVMLLLAATVFVAASTFAIGYFGRGHAHGHEEGTPGDASEHGSAGAAFWPLWYFLAAALNALFLSADIFNIYVTLELVGLAGVGLVSLAGRPAFGAAMRYLLVSLLGSLAYLLGVALLYGQYGTLDIAMLSQRIAPVPAVWLGAACMLGAMMAKSALVPLHIWLPPAHSSAPAPVSAVLSALVIKASFYLLVRMWFELFPALTTESLAVLAGTLGSVAIIWGSVLALRQSRLKLVVAYSTVAQVGYLFLVFPLTAGPASSAGLAVVIHMVSHGFAKAAMFLAAGAIVATTGRDDLAALRGLASRMPRATLAFALGGMVLMGLPPGGNFVSKWLYVESAVGSGQWWWVAVIGVGTLLAGAYLFRILRLFLALPADDLDVREAGALMTWPAVILAVLALALGLMASWPASLLERAPLAGLPPWGGGL